MSATGTTDERLAAVLAVAITEVDGLALDNLYSDWARLTVGRELAAALTDAGWVHRGEVADRLTAAIKLVQPEHLTPMGARQIRAVVTEHLGGER